MLLDIPFSGLHRIVSGGQTGSDQAGLFVARSFNIQTGGFAPRGFRTLVGPAPFLNEFGVVETVSADYSTRTKKNVESAEATIRLASNFDSPGEVLTLRYIRAAKQPFHDILLDEQDYDTKVNALVEFVINHCTGCLNIAGNGDRGKQFGYHFKNASLILSNALEILECKNLLIKRDN